MNRRDFLSMQALLLYNLASLPLVGCRNALRSAPVAKAKAVVCLHMVGGPSQMELFEYKPELYRSAGKRTEGFVSEKDQVGGTILKPIVSFEQYGKSGKWVSELLPNIAKIVDELAFINSVTCTSLTHAQAQTEMFTDSILPGHPFIGAWISYALDRGYGDLPNAVIMTDPLGPLRIKSGAWSRGTLPHTSSQIVFDDVLRDFSSSDKEGLQKKMVAQLNRLSKEGNFHDPFYQNRDELFGVAQQVVAKMTELFGPRPYTADEQSLYGITTYGENPFADQLIVARDLLQQGVPYIQIHCGDEEDPTSWDHHFAITDIINMTKKIDRPIYGFLTDLKQRGLLEETIVFWGGEFGRFPVVDLGNVPADVLVPSGRGHNNLANTVWLAGAGIKQGTVWGETDELSLRSVRDIVTMGDIWATILHLMGIDHRELEFRHDGGVKTFTKPFHSVINGVLA